MNRYNWKGAWSNCVASAIVASLWSIGPLFYHPPAWAECMLFVLIMNATYTRMQAKYG
jgi:hypothetical protein